jgi:hypothetical protein
MTPTMPRPFGLFFSLVACFSMRAVVAAPLVLECPSRYPGERLLSDLRQQGWYAPATGAAGSWLNQAGALTGPAEQNGELRGSDLADGSGRRFNFYGTEEDGEKWVFCNYANGRNDLRLIRAIPVGTKRCEAREKHARGRLVAASIWCE